MNELARGRDDKHTGALEEAKAILVAHRTILLEDAEFLRQIGLRPDECANVVPFAPRAFSRAAAAQRREAQQRRRLETIAEANFAAQAQTHATVIELLAAGGLADLARRLRHLARTRLGLADAVLAVESVEAPLGWRRLAPGHADMILDDGRRVRMGRVPVAHGLFTNPSAEIGSVALVRLQLWPKRRAGLLALSSADEEGLAEHMGGDLINFIAGVVERCADRWPP